MFKSAEALAGLSISSSFFSGFDFVSTQTSYHCNTLYHVYGLTDETGALIEAYEYNAYGKQTVITDGNDGDTVVNFGANDVRTVGGNSTVNNPKMYTGQRFDPETSLMYYKNRYFSTELGRFLSRDPIGYEGGINLYEYVKSRITKLVDRFGLNGDTTPLKPKNPSDNIASGALSGLASYFYNVGIEQPGTNDPTTDCTGASCGIKGVRGWSGGDKPPEGCRKVACKQPGTNCECCTDDPDDLELRIYFWQDPIVMNQISHTFGRNPCKENAWRTKDGKGNEWHGVHNPDANTRRE